MGGTAFIFWTLFSISTDMMVVLEKFDELLDIPDGRGRFCRDSQIPTFQQASFDDFLIRFKICFVEVCLLHKVDSDMKKIPRSEQRGI